MHNRKKNGWTWAGFFIYLLVLVQIILVKRPRFFLYRMEDTLFYRHYTSYIGLYANYHPLRTIRHLLFEDFHFMTALVNIGGNILLFIPLGIFLPMYFKAPPKMLKTIVTCFLLSTFFEVFQLITICGFFDVDDILLNTMGGAAGFYVYRLFMNHSSYSQKKLLATYAPN